MRRPTEKQSVEDPAGKAVKAAGGLYFKLMSPGTRGMPDRLIILPGRVIFVEFKRKGRRADMVQYLWVGLLKRMGCEAFVVDDIEHFKRIIAGAPGA